MAQGGTNLLQQLWRMVTPREASAEVIPGDPTALKLLQRMRTGPLPPAWREVFDAAEAMPERVTVFAEPRALPSLEPPTLWRGARERPRPGLPLQHYGYARTVPPGAPPGASIDLRAPGSSTIDLLSTRLPGGPDVAEIFAHELTHFLQGRLGVQPPKGYTYHDWINRTVLGGGSTWSPDETRLLALHPPLVPEEAPRPPWHPPDWDVSPPRVSPGEPPTPWRPPGATAERPSARDATTSLLEALWSLVQRSRWQP